MEENSNSKFDQWAIVELMGHQKIAGHVTEQSIAGGAFLRVDVPAVKRKKGYYDPELVDVPGFTRYLGTASIYAINPCTEAVATAAAASMHVYAPSLVDFAPQAALPTGYTGEEDDDEDPNFSTRS